MRKNIYFTSFAHLLGRTASFLLIGLVGCVANTESDSAEEVGEAKSAVTTSWQRYQEFSVNNFTGLTISNPGQACFLSGVTGNLNLGDIWSGPLSQPSFAGLTTNPSLPGAMVLMAHEGTYTNQVNQVLGYGNAVDANAVCMTDSGATTVVGSGSWTPYTGEVWMAGLGGPNRQCFLQSVSGVDGVWGSTNSYTQVFKITQTSSSYPQTGWYLDAGLPIGGTGYPTVNAVCYDFPTGSVISAQTSVSNSGPQANTYVNMPSTTLIDACGLTAFWGQFTDSNNLDDGVWLIPPSQQAGTWQMTAHFDTTNGPKGANAVCIH